MVQVEGCLKRGRREERILMRNDRVGWDCVCVCLYRSMCRRWHYKCTYTFR